MFSNVRSTEYVVVLGQGRKGVVCGGAFGKISRNKRKGKRTLENDTKSTNKELPEGSGAFIIIVVLALASEGARPSHLLLI